jgi:hypothetical protein
MVSLTVFTRTFLKVAVAVVAAALAADAVILKASIDENHLKATVALKNADTISEAKWIVHIMRIDPSCSGPLSWHIHEKRIPNSGDCMAAGGHWDPTFGCGMKSQYAGEKGLCKHISDYTKRPQVQTCEPDEDITTCEMGDLSGKIGDLKLVTGTQYFKDPYLSGNDAVLKELSLMFHVHCAGTTKMACANFKVV